MTLETQINLSKNNIDFYCFGNAAGHLLPLL